MDNIIKLKAVQIEKLTLTLIEEIIYKEFLELDRDYKLKIISPFDKAKKNIKIIFKNDEFGWTSYPIMLKDKSLEVLFPVSSSHLPLNKTYCVFKLNDFKKAHETIKKFENGDIHIPEDLEKVKTKYYNKKYSDLSKEIEKLLNHKKIDFYKHSKTEDINTSVYNIGFNKLIIKNNRITLEMENRERIDISIEELFLLPTLLK